MSTRATYEFKDEFDRCMVYIHGDGYPLGAACHIANALPLAWELPRFEAFDFAAALVAGNKVRGGGVSLTRNNKNYHADTEYHYRITMVNGHLYIRAEQRDNNEKWQLFWKGALSDFLKEYGEDLCWASEAAKKAAKKMIGSL